MRAPGSVGGLDDEDGKVDIAVTFAGHASVRSLLGRGDGGFRQAPVGVIALPRLLASGDVDGDGRPGLVASTSGPSLLLGNRSR